MRPSLLVAAATVLSAALSAQAPKKPTGVQLYQMQLSGIGG
jgi:hypothetical protein